MTFYQRTRFRRAFFSDSTRDMLKNLALIAVLFACFGIGGRMDYEDALRAEAEAHAARSDLNRASALSCLNGGAPGLYTENPDGSRMHIVCDDPPC